MLLSKSCVYGLRATLYLASIQDENYTSIRKLSDKLDISFHFLTKILQQLTAADLMESMTGPKGGVRLSRPGGSITLLDIVVAIDGDDLLTECVLGLPGCGKEKPCPMHEQWKTMRTEITKMLGGTDLNEMADKGKDMNLRITADGTFSWE